jgi:hypothetical protein
MKAAKAEAKIEDFRFHDFRHTRGTRIVRATGSLAAAKAALAHRRSRRRCATPMCSTRTCGTRWMHPSPELFPKVPIAKKKA